MISANKFRFGFIAILLICFAVPALAKYSGGTGEPNTPYQIANVADLNTLANEANDYNKCFILTADIDLDPCLPGGQVFTTAVIAPDTDNTQWNGFQGTQFTGIFDGKGHTIRNLAITASTQYYIGLFGNVGSGGEIRNLGVEDVNITGRFNIGGLVGFNTGTLTCSYATGSVSGLNGVGGLVGRNESGTLTDCNSTGSVSGTGGVGGLVGHNYSGTLTSCYATGSVTGTTNLFGGLVGINEYGELTSCYATGSVTGDYSVGGLVGLNEGTLTSCYATGSVIGISGVGGLVGYIYDGTITSCYATGLVTGNYEVGGLAALNDSADSLTSCFWDINTSGQTTSAGGTGKTTTEMQMQSTFTNADWDFDVNWAICETTNYPRLRWSIPAADLVCPDGVNFIDYTFFSTRWLNTNCAVNNNCDNTDFDLSGAIDIADLKIFCEDWLQGIN
jgi:hypothetical protein